MIVAGMLIRGVTIIDGSGKPGFRGDIAIDGAIITAVADRLDAVGRAVLDADGLVAAPGFIDVHSHTDRTIFHNPAGDSKIMQGVTTEVVCNCGIGPFPAVPERYAELLAYLQTEYGSLPAQGITWTDFAGFAKTAAQLRPGLNLAMLVAHGTLRIAAVGHENRPATHNELKTMQQMLATSLAQGAWGLSSGLIYPPGSFAQTDELLALARVAAKQQCLYSSHIRGESNSLMAAIDEAIAIGRDSGVRVLVSHLKAIGRPNWGRGLAALRQLTAARRSGIDIWADQYPYAATATSLTALVPSWAQSGGLPALLSRLADPALRLQLITVINEEIQRRGGADRIKIAGLSSPYNRQWVGKTLQDIAAVRQVPVAEAVRQLISEEAGMVHAVYFALDQHEVETIFTSPVVAVGSDGAALSLARDGHHQVHPRAYGTYPYILGRFVREQQLLPLETAVYKMTALPAKILRLPDRGLIKPGYKADITLFDADRVIDRATYDNPHQYPDGIIHVLVNGTFAVRAQHLTGTGRGYILKKESCHQTRRKFTDQDERS